MTNLPAPYRFPVWESLGQLLELRVAFLAPNEPHRRWSLPAAKNYEPITLKAIRFGSGERWRYALRPGATKDLGFTDALILPSWDNPAAWQLMHAARQTKMLTFNESHVSSSRHSDFVASALRKTFFISADGAITVGSRSSEFVHELGVSPSRIHQTKNPVVVGSLNEAANAAPVYEFVYCGQLIARKSPLMLLEALATLNNHSRLLFVGDGPMHAELARRAEELGVSGQVDFLGHVESASIPAILRSAKTLVLPSSEEVWGMVVSEALALGLQVVLNKRAGIFPDVEHMTGVFAHVDTPDSLAHSMSVSMANWSGPIPEPQVLGWTAERMAIDVNRAVRMTTARKRRTSTFLARPRERPHEESSAV